MATRQTYQRYGVNTNPDFDSLIQGQKATGDSLKEALGGIESLLNKTEEKYKQQNTLNMQEYLKGQLRSSGLGADPVNKVDIKKRFGDRINMDQIDETISSEKQLLKNEAINSASLAADDILNQSQDPIKAREAFTKKLRGLGADESLVNSATQDWSDAKETKFKDLLTLKSRKADERLAGVLSDIRSGTDQDMATEMAVSLVPEHERPAERLRLRNEIKKTAEMSERQVESLNTYVKRAQALSDRKVLKYQQEADELKGQLAALGNSGIDETSYAVSNKIKSNLGGNVANEIGDQLDNVWEKIFGIGDGEKFAQLQSELTNEYNINDEDASAIIAQSYGMTNKDGFWDGMNSDEMAAARAKALGLAANLKEKNRISGKLTAARNKVADVGLAERERIINLRQNLTDAARSKRLGVKDSEGMNPVYDNYMKEIKALQQAPTPDSDDGGNTGSGSDKGDKGGDSLTEEEKQKAEIERRKKIAAEQKAAAEAENGDEGDGGSSVIESEDSDPYNELERDKSNKTARKFLRSMGINDVLPEDKRENKSSSFGDMRNIFKSRKDNEAGADRWMNTLEGLSKPEQIRKLEQLVKEGRITDSVAEVLRKRLDPKRGL